MRIVKIFIIIFAFNVTGCGAEEVKVFNVTNGAYKEGIKYFNFYPEDNQKIYFVTQDDKFLLYNIKSKKTDFLEGISKKGYIINDPVWSADGSYIAFLHEKNIFIYRVKTQEISQLTKGLEVLGPMSWKNNYELFFTSREKGILRGSIKILNADNGEIKTLFESKDKEHYAVHKYVKATSELFYAFNDNKSDDITQDLLYRSKLPVTVDGTLEIKLQDKNIVREMGGALDVSTDGRLVLFDGIDASSPNPSTDLLVANITTGEVTVLLRDNNYNFMPKFSSDSNKVIFLTQYNGENEILDIRIVSFLKSDNREKVDQKTAR